MRHAAARPGRIERGIWAPFQSLLGAQVIAAVFGLVFWVIVARLVDQHEVGVAAAAISAQTLLGMICALGLGTMLIAELPQHSPQRQRRLILRSLLVILVFAGIAGSLLVVVGPALPANLREALGTPLGAGAFVVGVIAAASAMVLDECCLGLRRSNVQVGRNLLAVGLRFPMTAVLLVLGWTNSQVLQLCWVLPLLISVPAALWRLRLPRGDQTSPTLRTDVATYAGPALRNHSLSLSLAGAAQMVPVVAGLTLTSVENAEFAIAWLMATFVFLPPYLLAAALFAHGANVSTEEFRSSMEKTIPASLLLSFALCVGAWVFGEPVLRIFGGDYATGSWQILALLVPAGLWMVFKDHLVALWRSQRRFGLATRLAGAAIVLEIAGATIGALLGGPIGLCLGWLSAMVLESVLGIPWLRQAFGGLHWQSPLTLRRRTQVGKVAPHVVTAVALVLVIGGVGVWSATQNSGGTDPSGNPSPSRAAPTSSGSAEPTAEPPSTAMCPRSTETPGPAVDLGVQAATGDRADPLRNAEEIRELVRIAKEAGASVISTTASFRALQPDPGIEYRFGGMDNVIAAARAAGLEVRLRMMGMPTWALDEPIGAARQPPETEAELDRWATFVRDVMEHVDGKVSYAEVWNEPNSQRYWPTGADPIPFMRLMATSYEVIKSVSPDTGVISGGLIGNDIGYLEQMYDAVDVLELDRIPFDLVGVHPFTGSAPPAEVNPERVYERDPWGLYDENFTGYKALHDVMVDRGDRNKPIYISQFGYSTRAFREFPPVPDDVRAGYLTEAYDEVTCTTYVEGFSWFAFHETPWDPPAWTLLGDGNQPNLTYSALQEWSQSG